MLADTLKAVLSVTLIKKADNSGRVQAMEIMLVNAAIRNLIREGKTHLIPNVIQTSRAQGMRTMDDCLHDYFTQGLITQEMVERHARNIDIALGTHNVR
ncbi:twitching motility protein PilT [gut metagenome]|uniref:Twitching motility protein PilT n=1 Tax=gut metagenome TaxID=749906 RepID=J9GW80_9ZZZZ